MHTHDQILQPTGVCGSARCPGGAYATSGLVWVDTATGERRIPREILYRFDPAEGFTAADSDYTRLRQLRQEWDEENGCWLDIYGRQVLYYKERSPCFGSFDFMREKTFFHWFLLRESSSLTRIFYADGSDTVYVTEDVGFLETSLLALLSEYGWYREP